MKDIVYPTKESALNIIHPIDGKLEPGGSPWERDGFTCRMIADGIVTMDAHKAWSPGK